MSERVVTPGGPWVSVGAFEVRTVREDLVGTIRVRPTSTTEPRRFKDCDGDTWTEYVPGELRLTERSNGGSGLLGALGSIEDIQAGHGPLTEIRPVTDVRALLADVLEELAIGANRRRFVSADCAWIANTFSAKAQELRKGIA
ncbi:hypothetical protein [Streptomyces sp. or20]|uniref:hypothetical protein n=1 Tax=Streptomyces sp. or20 TaxID=1828016 RepID=UPI00117E963B|nr:hypothetical protein [Streptomyces sp. or20]